MTSWNPSRIERVVKVLSTSTKPIFVETDVGPALLKYMGNPQGYDALIAEHIAAELADLLKIPVPNHKLICLDVMNIDQAGVSVESGPAFLSSWISPAITFSPDSNLVRQIRDPDFFPMLVVFDTWIKNRDRFVPTPGASAPNYDNLLFAPDKQKIRAYLIDHTHAFVETTFEDEISQDNWWDDEVVLGVFPNVAGLLNREAIMTQIDKISAIKSDQIRSILETIPYDWQMTEKVKEATVNNLRLRAKHLCNWLPAQIFGQSELNYPVLK